jgi:hypothetical protein
MPWFAFPFGDERIKQLSTQYGVSGIPWLVILNKEGKLIENEADNIIQTSPTKAYDTWIANK